MSQVRAGRIGKSREPRGRQGQTFLFLGILITLLQLIAVMIAVPGSGSVASRWTGAYRALCQWDCAWYEQIAQNGYRSTIPPVRQNPGVSNVAFFPGYPILARVLSQASGLSPRVSLLLVAQTASVVFWTVLCLFLARLRIPTSLSMLAVLAIVFHPAGFFLVVGYSESLFLAAFLLFLLNSSRTSRRPGHLISGTISGFVMSSTRIVGLPISGYPVLVAFLKRRGLKATTWILLFAGAAGAIAFFIYCRLRFGQFNLYMETQRIGWGILPNYLAIANWRHHQYFYRIDRIASLGSLCAFTMFFVLEALSGHRGRSRRIPLYISAFLVYFISVSGLESVGFRSMIRYSLPWYILLVLCCVHWIRTHIRLRESRWTWALVGAAGLALTAWGGWVQLPHLRDFLSGRWFA